MLSPWANTAATMPSTVNEPAIFSFEVVALLGKFTGFMLTEVILRGKAPSTLVLENFAP